MALTVNPWSCCLSPRETVELVSQTTCACVSAWCPALHGPQLGPCWLTQTMRHLIKDSKSPFHRQVRGLAMRRRIGQVDPGSRCTKNNPAFWTGAGVCSQGSGWNHRPSGCTSVYLLALAGPDFVLWFPGYPTLIQSGLSTLALLSKGLTHPVQPQNCVLCTWNCAQLPSLVATAIREAVS